MDSESKRVIDKWAYNEALPWLKKYGYLKKDYSKLKILSALFIGVMISGIFFYGIQTESFKSNFNQSIDPNVSVQNSYNFSTPIENDYEFKPNYTIIVYNNNILPENLCDCGS